MIDYFHEVEDKDEGKEKGKNVFEKKSSRGFILILLILSDKTKKKGMFSFLPAIVRWVKQNKLFRIPIILFKKIDTGWLKTSC